MFNFETKKAKIKKVLFFWMMISKDLAKGG